MGTYYVCEMDNEERGLAYHTTSDAVRKDARSRDQQKEWGIWYQWPNGYEKLICIVRGHREFWEMP